MRVHIILDDDLVAELDRRAGERGRTRFIATAIRRMLDDEQRWEAVESGFGILEDGGHDGDDDPAAWIHAQRYGDDERVG